MSTLNELLKKAKAQAKEDEAQLQESYQLGLELKRRHLEAKRIHGE